MLSLLMVVTSLVVIGSALYGGYQTVHCLVAWHRHATFQRVRYKFDNHNE